MPLLIRRTTYVIRTHVVRVLAAPAVAPIPQSWHDRFGFQLSALVGIAATLATASFTTVAPILALAFVAAGSLTYFLLDTRIGQGLFAALVIAGLIVGFAALDHSHALQYIAAHHSSF